MQHVAAATALIDALTILEFSTQIEILDHRPDNVTGSVSRSAIGITVEVGRVLIFGEREGKVRPQILGPLVLEGHVTTIGGE